ncbi:MAG: glutamine synthetase type III, partial [Eubacterium sp.]|nr:glutamine synthetase type III [Eubacterium sp.]
LGANEAPPAVISIFLGDELTAILEAIENDVPYGGTKKEKMQLGVDVLPKFSKDTTDRNRTSPFAFTGNKFEFRMLGSSQSVASPNVVLNTMMAEELSRFADALEQSDNFQVDLQNLIRDTFRDHQRIIFNGNGYGAEWTEEAARRGLSNLKDTVDCMPAYIDPKNVELFTRHGIFSYKEMHARYEIHLENYCKVTTIEANTLLEMTLRHILPAVFNYSRALTDGLCRQEQGHVPVSQAQRHLVERLNQLSDDLYDSCHELQAALDDAPALDGGIESARYFRDQVALHIRRAAELINQLEIITAAEYWPYPTYADILFSV